MLTKTMTMAAWAAMSVAPAIVAAQTTTPPPTVTLPTCDCPQGEGKGDLRNLGAFAPLGLLGALAAAGGTPGLFAAAGGKEAANPSVTVASNTPPSTSTPGAGVLPGDGVSARSDGARNPSGDAPASGIAPSMNRTGLVPDAVSPDSLRAGLRAPNTGTPLPSVFLLGSGLIAVGCVTILRTRS